MTYNTSWITAQTTLADIAAKTNSIVNLQSEVCNFGYDKAATYWLHRAAAYMLAAKHLPDSDKADIWLKALKTFDICQAEYLDNLELFELA